MEVVPVVKTKHFLLALSIFLISLTSFASPSATRLTNKPSHDLSHKAQLLRDPGATLTVSDVATKPDSQLIDLDSDVSLGFTSDVAWIKVTMARESESDPDTWYMVLGQTVLKDARLYKPLPNGGFTEHYGTQVNNENDREIDHRRPIFIIHHDVLGEKTYWIRIQTPTALNTSLKVVQEKEFLTETTKESFFWGLIFGGYIISIIFYISFWTWTKETIHKNYIAYISINFLAALFTGGWPTLFTTNLNSETLITLLGIWISLSIAIGTRFSIEFIDLKIKNFKISKILLISANITTIIGITSIIIGHYRWAMPALQASSMVLISIFIVISSYYSVKNDSKSKFFLFAFSLFYFGVFWRYLRNISVIDPNFWNENIYQITAFGHMVVMSIGIFANYNKLRKEKQIAESRADAEFKLREEQREFLSLVSHEFRTPLTISGASVDNLLQQPDLSLEALKRVNKILKANERMQSLMDSYLSKERLLMDVLKINIENQDIGQLCRLAVSDMPDADVADIKIDISEVIEIKCDAEMVRIALNNLLQNALRFSPQPGSIKISVRMEAKNLSIKVSDKGLGIPEDELDLIFTRYYRGKNSMNQPGAGLGLNLVKTVLDKHGGTITVFNLPDKGCEFILNFPQ